MFVTWILNFQLNLRKIISLEHPMKLERLVDEVFFYQNMYYLHVEMIRRCHRRRSRKIVRKSAKFFLLTFLYLTQKNEFFLDLYF